MRHTLVGAAAAATVVSLLAGCAGGPSAGGGGGKISNGGITLGVLTDLSGVYSSIAGRKAIAAVQLAVDDFKAKYGTKAVTQNIKVVSADHQNKPDVAGTQAREMYERQNVDAIFDVPTSSAALAVATVAKQERRIYVNVGAATQDLSGKACNKYTYAWAYDAYMLANGTGTGVTKRGGGSWYILYPDYVFGQGMQAAFSTAIQGAGGQIIGKDPTPFPGKDFSTFLLKAAGHQPKPQVLGAMQAGGDLVTLVKQYNQYGLRDKGIQLAVGLLFDSDIKSIGAQSLQDTLFTTAWFWGLDAQSRAWAQRFKARTGEAPNFDQAGNYSAATQYLEAVQRAGTDNADAVTKQLNGLSFTDVFGRNAQVRASDHRVVHDAYLAQVRKPGQAADPDDLASLVATIPAAQAFEPPSTECHLS